MARDTPADAVGPRKRPKQARSAVTVEAILEAATRILATDAVSAFNTNRVAGVAGISIGSLYQYFPNKSSLIAALIQRQQDGLAEAVESIVRDVGHADLHDALGKLVDAAIAQQFTRPRCALVLDDSERSLPVAEALDPANARIVAALRALLGAHHSRCSASLPPEAAEDCVTIAKALIDTAARSADVDLRALRHRVLRALHGYLGLAGPGD